MISTALYIIREEGTPGFIHFFNIEDIDSSLSYRKKLRDLLSCIDKATSSDRVQLYIEGICTKDLRHKTDKNAKRFVKFCLPQFQFLGYTDEYEMILKLKSNSEIMIRKIK